MKKTDLSKVNLYSISLMVLTSIHHVYGAIIYNTPWRNHVLLVSIPVILIALLSEWFLAIRTTLLKKVLFWIYWMIILVLSIAMIGVFEGIYNHLVKDIFYYSGISQEVMMKLFPPPTYEMPDDFWFEFTGVLQAFIVLPLIVSFVKLTRKN